MTTVQVSRKIDEPIEIRIQFGTAPTARLYILTAWRTPQGTIGHSMAVNGNGTPESLANLQSKGTFPGKAVHGWQVEVLDFAKAGLGTVVEVR